MTEREAFAATFNVPRETMAKFDRYAELLEDWQQRMNLVGAATLPQVWTRHFADSAQLVRFAAPGSWLDIGAGAGFPGVVAALLGAGPVHLAESTGKKCQFLQHVADELGLSQSILVHRSRVEQMGAFPVKNIVARACAPLAQLLDWGLRFAESETLWLLPKGESVETEVAAARLKFRFDLTLVPSLSDPARAHRAGAQRSVPVMRVAIANQKGGVGKTTTAINLGTALAAMGQTVLLIDSDPQGNASTGLGIGRDARSTSIYEVLLGEATLAEATIPTRIPGLSLIASTAALSGAEVELVSLDRRMHRLADALDAGRAADWVLIDCPPSLGLLTLNALVAADRLLIPLQSEFFALEGLSQLLATVERVRTGPNPRLGILGVVLTMADRRNRLSEAVAADVRAVMGAQVFATSIPRNVRLSEAPSHGLPALIYDLKCPGSQAYLALAREVIDRGSTMTQRERQAV